MSEGPLVSIVTPVLNGERYLAEAIDSVLGQTYRRWELIVVDNASTDATPAIARAHAERDRRIRVLRNERTVGVIENHNIAFREVSADATYVKPLHADDWLFPECLARMVDVVESHPSVGLVSAFALVNGWVDLDGLPYPSTVMPGREIARLGLLGGPYVFGSPSSVLLRADLVRGRTPFFDRYFPPLAETLERHEAGRLLDLNLAVLRLLYGFLGMADNLALASSLGFDSRRDDRVADLCEALGATVYLANSGSRDYIEPGKFHARGIGFVFQDYRHPEYAGAADRPPFTPYLSVVDLLFRRGPESADVVASGCDAAWRAGVTRGAATRAGTEYSLARLRATARHP